MVILIPVKRSCNGIVVAQEPVNVVAGPLPAVLACPPRHGHAAHRGRDYDAVPFLAAPFLPGAAVHVNTVAYTTVMAGPIATSMSPLTALVPEAMLMPVALRTSALRNSAVVLPRIVCFRHRHTACESFLGTGMRSAFRAVALVIAIGTLPLVTWPIFIRGPPARLRKRRLENCGFIFQ